ncbi:hypothetical protein SSOG_07278 [Streptomyces himastatinicus ATCC 53653]|uniref:Secreted protein n=1 Tax=Streptomyces himastatinicus ATCC 53653 TaxID=457427 RepID=D9WIR1_9ACTN|nr:hypothetical protein [Streptomyces himastatinicus]EFL27564.1 hypothetical protein SSOG_07278 [Streptomyces himastatinicus ATCC 53653]
MSNHFARRIAFGAMSLAGIASAVAVTAPAASAAPAADGKVRVCNHASGYRSFVAFTTRKHTTAVGPGHCSAWRPSIKVGELAYVQGLKKGDAFQMGSYKVPTGSYQVDTRGTPGTATFRIVHK